MEDNQHFEELVTQADVAKQLGVSVATLKKYSLIIEDVTGNRQYYARTKRNSRLYSQKNIEELKTLRNLAKEKKLTLQDAAQQMFLISNKDNNDKVQLETLAASGTLVDAKQVVNLLNMLQQTIVTQNKAIQDLQAQVARVEQQNQELIESSHRLPTTQAKDTSTNELNSSVSATNENSSTKNKTNEKADQEVEDAREEILRKARENQKKRAQQNVHRTLAEMQIHQKKRWWQRIFR